jgi:hypothetical protein
MALTLADDLAHHRVTLDTITTWDEAPPRGRVIFAAQSEDPRADASAWIRVGQPRWQLGDDSYAIGEPGGPRSLLDAILARLFS